MEMKGSGSCSLFGTAGSDYNHKGQMAPAGGCVLRSGLFSFPEVDRLSGISARNGPVAVSEDHTFTTRATGLYCWCTQVHRQREGGRVVPVFRPRL